MRLFQKYIASLFTLQLVVVTATATVSLPKIIGDNMVLQRGAAVAIWGLADAGENITVQFAGQTKQTVANNEGHWKVSLLAMPASDKPQSMTITGTNIIVLKNILVGEVWLCSGQSNMEYTMTKSGKYAHAKRSTGLDSTQIRNEKQPLIRLFLVKRDLTKPGDLNKGWQVAEDGAVGTFSAAGYYFARKLSQELHVPVGMIASSVSGSAIEPWMSGEVKKDSATQSWQVDETFTGKFYTGMIKPLAPFTLKGFLWYQGKTNCFQRETTEYSFKFKRLINSWRKLWNKPDASFYFVQIAPFAYSKSQGKVQLSETDLPAFRQAQAAALSLPNTGMIVTTDLVDNLSDIHPTYKWEIGRRLALLALVHDYHNSFMCSGPVAKKVERKNHTVEVSFDAVGKGLCAIDKASLTDFELAGADGVYVPADAKIVGNKVLVQASSVPSPASIRFAWREGSQPNFFNKDGLPAVPFERPVNGLVTAKNKTD